MLLAASLFVPAPRSDAEWGGVGGLSAGNPQPPPNPVTGDTDGDGIPNTWESANLLNPANAADAATDFDRDGLTALQEYGLHLASAGASGKHLGTWAASWLPRPTGFIGTPRVTIVEQAPNGIILAQVSGRLSDATVSTTFPYTWSPASGTWTRVLPPPGVTVTSLTSLDVNSSGQVVGYYSSGGTRGFVWTPAAGGGESAVFQLHTASGSVHAVPKRISDSGHVVGNIGSLSGTGFAGTSDGDEITFSGLLSNPVFHDVNDYGEFIGSASNPLTWGMETFLAVPGQPVFSTGIGGAAFEEMAGVWGDLPEIDPGEIVWDEGPSGYSYFREGTAIDTRTGNPVAVHEGYGAAFYWYYDSGGYYDTGWYSYPGFSHVFAGVNDWGEFTGHYNASLYRTDFTEYDQSGYSGFSQGGTDTGIFFYEGDYHVSKARPSIYGVSNDPRVLIGTPYALWSGSLVVPVTNLLPAGYPTSFAYARLADNGRVILQQSTTSQILLLTPNQDSDGDGMPNDWEVFYGLNPADAQDAAADANQNGTSNRAEFALRANPLAAAGAGAGVQFIDLRPGIDTDGDGMPNTWEWKHGLNHSNASDAVSDYDGDGLSNLKEFLLGTDPHSGDTDHDSVADGDEVANGTDPRAKTDYDVDGISDDFEKHFAKQFLAVNPDPLFWAGLHTGLLGGDLDPSVDYTGEGLTARELPELFEPALDPGPPASGYLVQPQTRHNAWEWAYYRAGSGGTSIGQYVVSQPYDYDLGTIVSTATDFSSLYLSTRIGMVEWGPRTIPALVPWNSTTDANYWSKATSVFLQDTAPNDPETTRYRGVIREQRLQIVATRADHEPLHETYLKVTLQSPAYEAAGATEILLVDPFEIKIPKGKFFSPWFELKADMLDGKETIVVLLPVELKDLSNNQVITDTAWIKGHKTDGSSEEPEWPKLEARIYGLPADMQVEWKLENRYPRRSGRDDLNVPGVDGAELGIFTTGSEAWKIWETVQNTSTPYFGGDVKVKFQLHDSSGGSGTWNEVSFKIRGENPDDVRCKNHIMANQGSIWYAWAIAKHESGDSKGDYNQFANGLDNGGAGAHGAKGEPFYAPSEGDGWGLFQRDSASGVPVTTKETWSWDGNMRDFINDEYPEQLRIANNYVDSVKRNNPNTFVEPQFTIKGQAISGRDVLALTWYNGPQGRSNSRLMPFNGGSWSLDLPNAPEKSQPYAHEIMDTYNGH